MRLSVCLESRVNLPSIFAEAKLNPVPIRETNTGAESHDTRGRDSPWRAEQQQVESQQQGRCQVETEIDVHGKLQSLRNKKTLVNSRDAPVQNRDEHFQRHGDNGNSILGFEQRLAGSQIGDCAKRESYERRGQTNNGQELEVPSICIAQWGLPGRQEVKAIRKRGDANHVQKQRADRRRRGETLKWVLGHICMYPKDEMLTKRMSCSVQ